ncbi:stage III sporulation protein AA [Feifania hominis]|uniref:Stage III sporulation protein AA n=1 Tax=Feifania hominis TaxID=2763660 RepID=A0A926HU36_9FIRM|nr:stage III sporulation protein AA [Feifania hominis]MBC8535535.1 stage III sporulation protein AA [Feifania hominis]
MTGRERRRELFSLLPPRVSALIEHIGSEPLEALEEIRLRAQRPVSLTLAGHNYFISEDAEITYDASRAVCLTPQELEQCYLRACENSVYTFQEDIARGFVTVKNGNRVGIAGSAVVEAGRVVGFRNISSLCLRFAREIRGAGEQLFERLYPDGTVVGTLIVSPPKMGKTTLLRDLIRTVSCRGLRVAVVDERGELAAMRGGAACSDIGPCTDVLDAIPKAIGCEYAIRNLSPEVIAFDEIGSMGEVEAVLQSLNAGVPVLTTCHAGSWEELWRRPPLRALLGSSAICKVIKLNNKKTGVVDAIWDWRSDDVQNGGNVSDSIDNHICRIGAVR